jgi:hypothetical protein
VQAQEGMFIYSVYDIYGLHPVRIIADDKNKNKLSFPAIEKLLMKK